MAAVESSGQARTPKSPPAKPELPAEGRPTRLARHGTPAMSTPLLITGAATSSFAIGFVPALVDSLAGALRQQLKAQERWAAVIVAVFYITWLPMMPLSGWAVDRGYIKEVLFFGLLGCALGVAWLGL